MAPTNPYALRHIKLHGHDVGYRMAGSGPAVVLIHGLAGSSPSWREVMPQLAQHHTVIAPDLLGHGESAKPRGDYSLGAYADGIRDLLVALGIEHATFVGHSLGGGIAMQLAYQFPERCERLVLVASGGLGREVNTVLRLVSIPGSELILDLVLNRRIHDVAGWVGSVIRRTGFRLDRSATEMWRSYSTLATHSGRQAFVHTVRSVIDVSGQRVSAADRLYLAGGVPTMIVWGDRDGIIPVEHAYDAHDLIPGSRLEILEGAGHFLPFEDADRFLPILEDFLATTRAAVPSEDDFRELLLTRSHAS
ncbi:MAG: alpha/beta fold hydrolase [Acidimicrobiales bacterium]